MGKKGFAILLAADFKSADPKEVRSFFDDGFQIRRSRLAGFNRREFILKMLIRCRFSLPDENKSLPLHSILCMWRLPTNV